MKILDRGLAEASAGRAKRGGDLGGMRRAAPTGMSRKSDLMAVQSVRTNVAIGETIKLEKLHNPQQRKQVDRTTKKPCQAQTDNTSVFPTVQPAFLTAHRRIPMIVPRDLRMRSASC